MPTAKLVGIGVSLWLETGVYSILQHTAAYCSIQYTLCNGERMSFQLHSPALRFCSSWLGGNIVGGRPEGGSGGEPRKRAICRAGFHDRLRNFPAHLTLDSCCVAATCNQDMSAEGRANEGESRLCHGLEEVVRLCSGDDHLRPVVAYF